MYAARMLVNNFPSFVRFQITHFLRGAAARSILFLVIAIIIEVILGIAIISTNLWSCNEENVNRSKTNTRIFDLETKYLCDV
jgi:hypothetical protein